MLKKKNQTEVCFQRFSILIQQKKNLLEQLRFGKKVKYGIDLTIEFNN